MFQKDYLMRLIETLLDAINKIVNSIDKEDIERAKMQLRDSFRLLGKEEDYFHNTNCDELIKFFKSKEGNYLKRVQLLAELLYLDSRIEKNDILKLESIKKAKTLLLYYTKFSKEYSFEVNNKLMLINSELDNFPLPCK
ncbi:hypothetical protein LNI96_00870 [Tenacibaculum dicentrarchi]|nr:hypothetical protein [Tenacibaculum dicentrarchi]